MYLFPLFRPLGELIIQEMTMHTLAFANVGLSIIEANLRMTELIYGNGRLFVSDPYRLSRR